MAAAAPEPFGASSPMPDMGGMGGMGGMAMGGGSNLANHPGAKYAAQGFASLDINLIQEQKKKAADYLEQQSAAAQDMAKQQLDAQRELIELENTRETELMVQQITAKKDHDLMMH